MLAKVCAGENGGLYGIRRFSWFQLVRLVDQSAQTRMQQARYALPTLRIRGSHPAPCSPFWTFHSSLVPPTDVRPMICVEDVEPICEALEVATCGVRRLFPVHLAASCPRTQSAGVYRSAGNIVSSLTQPTLLLYARSLALQRVLVPNPVNFVDFEGVLDDDAEIGEVRDRNAHLRATVTASWCCCAVANPHVSTRGT